MFVVRPTRVINYVVITTDLNSGQWVITLNQNKNIYIKFPILET